MSLTGWLAIPAGQIASLRPLLDEHIRLTRAEPGCVAFSVTPSPEIPDRYEVRELFRDRAAFETHQRRTKASAWGAATRHIERHYTVSQAAEPDGEPG